MTFRCRRSKGSSILRFTASSSFGHCTTLFPSNGSRQPTSHFQPLQCMSETCGTVLHNQITIATGGSYFVSVAMTSQPASGSTPMIYRMIADVLWNEQKLRHPSAMVTRTTSMVMLLETGDTLAARSALWYHQVSVRAASSDFFCIHFKCLYQWRHIEIDCACHIGRV